MPFLDTDRTKGRAHLRGRRGRCGRYFVGSCSEHSLIVLRFPHPRDPPAFKAASHVAVAEERASRAPGPDGAVEILKRLLRASCSGNQASPTRPGAGSPDTPPPPPVGAGLEYADGPMGARSEGFRPAVRRSGLHLHRPFAVASRKGVLRSWISALRGFIEFA